MNCVLINSHLKCDNKSTIYERGESKMTKNVTSDTLEFIQDNVLNVTELVRTKKLTQILDQFADVKSTDIYVVQNDKKRNARGVIVDFEYFQELLRYKEAVDAAIDEHMEQVALSRINNPVDVPLEEVLKSEDISFEEIRYRMNEIELDEE